MQYIVYVSDKDEQGQAAFRGEGRRAETQYVGLAKYHQRDANIDNDPIGIGTYILDDLKTAQGVAEWVVKKRPNLDVYIAKTEFIVSGKAVETVTKSVTAKGVLPA
jgi:hypothetical protein